MRANILIAVLALTLAVPATACQCRVVRSAIEARGVSTWVFDGTAVEQIPTLVPSERGLLPTQKVRFIVHNVWKGSVGPEVMLLEGMSNCSTTFSAGERYLVFATPHETQRGWLDAYKCTGPTGPVEWARSSVASLGAPLVTYRHAPRRARGHLPRLIQNARVYGLAAFVVLYYGLLTQSVWVWAPALLVLVANALAGVVIVRRAPRPRAIIVVAALSILALGLAVVLIGAFFVHDGGALEHLLERPRTGAEILEIDARRILES